MGGSRAVAEPPGTIIEQLAGRLASRQDVLDELEALIAIYGESKVTQYQGASSSSVIKNEMIRLLLETTLPSHEDLKVAFIVSISPSYPQTSRPQLQLSNKYIGEFATDSTLFGTITRLYLQEGAWTEGEVAIFEGIERAREVCETFYDSRQADLQAKKAVDDHATQDDLELARQLQYEEDSARSHFNHANITREAVRLPDGCKLYTSDPIIDRKSVFIGHACKLTHPSEVDQIRAFLLSDRKIAKATHPVMLAYRCKGSGNIMHQDNDDDGETAAGSRLAHLLQILDIDNVLVVVTRWYGGIQLGSDRFRHINQAARDALLLGGFIKAGGKR